MQYTVFPSEMRDFNWISKRKPVLLGNMLYFIVCESDAKNEDVGIVWLSSEGSGAFTASRVEEDWVGDRLFVGHPGAYATVVNAVTKAIQPVID